MRDAYWCTAVLVRGAANWRGVKLLGCLTPVPGPAPRRPPRRPTPPSFNRAFVSHFHSKVRFFSLLLYGGESAGGWRHRGDDFGRTLSGANLKPQAITPRYGPFLGRCPWVRIGHPAGATNYPDGPRWLTARHA